MNRTIIEKARCMLFEANLEKKFWAEAVATEVYLINRSPSRALNGKIPEELWSNKIIDYNRIKIFGCVCYSHIAK